MSELRVTFLEEPVVGKPARVLLLGEEGQTKTVTLVQRRTSAWPPFRVVTEDGSIFMGDVGPVAAAAPVQTNVPANQAPPLSSQSGPSAGQTCPSCGLPSYHAGTTCPKCHAALAANRPGVRGLAWPFLRIPLPVTIAVFLVVCLILIAVAYWQLSGGSDSAHPAAGGHGPTDGDVASSDPGYRAAAKSAVQAMEALASACRSGVVYHDYLARKADARVGLDRFLNEYPDTTTIVANNLEAAMDQYDEAARLWEQHLTHSYSSRSDLDAALSETWGKADRAVMRAREALPSD